MHYQCIGSTGNWYGISTFNHNNALKASYADDCKENISFGSSESGPAVSK